MNYYTLNANNEPLGPVSLEDLKAAMRNGTLNAESLVCQEGDSDWMPIKNLLKGALKVTSNNPIDRGTRYVYGLVGIVIGIGITLLLSLMWSKSASTGSPQSDVYFEVIGPAQSPDGAWYGLLVKKGSHVRTAVIVDFGKVVNLAEYDRLEGTFIPTSEVGQWNKTPNRIYKSEGDFKLLNPLTLNQ